MMISFFEEFPNDSCLKKLDLIDFDTKIYLGARSFKEFNGYKRKIKNKHVKEIIYWPILLEEQGYWFSPWVKSKYVEQIFKELKNEPVMIDLELPKNRKLMILESFNFFKNRFLLRKLIKEYHGDKYTAEYFSGRNFVSSLMQFFGINMSPNKYGNKIIKMIYRSIWSISDQEFKKVLEYGKILYKDSFLVGLGCIDLGINANESLLSEWELGRDLRICMEVGIREVIIFRLNGLNYLYKKEIKKISL